MPEDRAESIREKVAEIEAQLEENGKYVVESTDAGTEQPVRLEYGPEAAQKMKEKLIREAEKLEGYPWSERSHTGIMAMIASVIRAVKYAVLPDYRDQVRQMQAEAEHQPAAAHTQTEKKPRENPRENPEPSRQEPKRTQERENPVPEPEKGEPQKAREPEYTEAEKETMEKIRQNIHALDASRPEEITPAVARKVMKDLKNQEFLNAKEAGNGDQWWKKESWYAGFQILQKHPVLAHGLSEKESASYAASLLVKSPKSVEFFEEKALRAAVPAFLEKAGRDPRHTLDQHLSWVERDAKNVPVLNAVLEEAGKLQQEPERSIPAAPEEPIPVPEAPAPEVPAPETPIPEGPVPAMPDPDMGEPETDLSGMNADRSNWEQEPEVEIDMEEASGTNWISSPEFDEALRAYRRENMFADIMEPETLKQELLSRNPDLIQSLPPEEMTYGAVFTAACNDLSVLKYVPQDIRFEREDGGLDTLKDLESALRQEMPMVAAHMVSQQGISMQEAVDEICRNPKDEDRRNAADRRDVENLKSKIRSDYEKDPDRWEPELGQQGIEFV